MTGVTVLAFCGGFVAGVVVLMGLCALVGFADERGAP